MIDHVGIYGSRVAEGLSAFNVGLVHKRRHSETSRENWQINWKQHFQFIEPAILVQISHEFVHWG